MVGVAVVCSVLGKFLMGGVVEPGHHRSTVELIHDGRSG